MSILEGAYGLLAPLARLIAGRVLGSSAPGRVRQFPERDGREAALRVLRQYVAAIPFDDPSKPGQSLRIAPEDVHADFADPEQEPRLPAAGVVSAEANLDFDYLGATILLDDTYGCFGQGTALALFGWHDELIVLEVWCRDVPQRRAVVAGLKLALHADEDRACVDLRLPDYFGRTARFYLVGAHVIDEPESLRGGRRRALLRLRLKVPEVVLVDAGTMRPMSEVGVTSSA